MRTRMPPNSRVRQYALPESPSCSVRSIVDQSVVPNGMPCMSIATTFRGSGERRSPPALAHREVARGLALDPREPLYGPPERHHRAHRDVPREAEELLDLRL